MISEYQKQSLYVVSCQSIWDDIFHLTPAIVKFDQIRPDTKLCISCEILIVFHSNFPDCTKIQVTIILSSFQPKYSGWHFHPTLAMGKLDQVWPNTYLAISCHILILVHSNFTYDIRILEAIILCIFQPNYLGWPFHPTLAITNLDQISLNT